MSWAREQRLTANSFLFVLFLVRGETKVSMLSHYKINLWPDPQVPPYLKALQYSLDIKCTSACYEEHCVRKNGMGCGGSTFCDI